MQASQALALIEGRDYVSPDDIKSMLIPVCAHRIITRNHTRGLAVIVATTGFNPAERIYYEGLQKRGVIIATTFPSGDNVASPGQTRETFPLIAIQRMLPTHARILMMLALTKTQDAREIQRIFDQY